MTISNSEVQAFTKAVVKLAQMNNQAAQWTCYGGTPRPKPSPVNISHVYEQKWRVNAFKYLSELDISELLEGISHPILGKFYTNELERRNK